MSDEKEKKRQRHEVVAKSLYFILENGDKEEIDRVTQLLMTTATGILTK